MEKPPVEPNGPAATPDETAAGEEERPAKAGEAEPAANRARATKSGTEKATAKKTAAKKTAAKKPAAKKSKTNKPLAKQAATKPAVPDAAPAEPQTIQPPTAELPPAETAAAEPPAADRPAPDQRPAVEFAAADAAPTEQAEVEQAEIERSEAEPSEAEVAAAEQQPAERPAVARPAAAPVAAAEAGAAGGSVGPLDGLSEATRDLVRAAAEKEGEPVDDWVERALAEAADRTLNPRLGPLGSAEEMLPSIGEMSQKLDTLRHAISDEDSKVAKLAGQLKGSADEIATNLGQRIKVAAKKAPPIDEVTARLKRSVRYVREHAAFRDVASRWRARVGKIKWRDHIRQAYRVARDVLAVVKGKAEAAIEAFRNRQSRRRNRPERHDERSDGTE